MKTPKTVGLSLQLWNVCIVATKRETIALNTKRPQNSHMGNQYPWRDKSWLESEYLESGKSVNQIADEQDTSTATIYNWIQKHDINQVHTETVDDNNPVNDKSKLRQMHLVDGLSVNAISNKCGVSRDTVKSRLEKFDIERKYKCNPDSMGVLYTGSGGYERFNAGRNTPTIRIHRLVACLDNDPKEVFHMDSCAIHHKNEIPWDNRPSNISVVTRAEHNKIHNKHKHLPTIDG